MAASVDPRFLDIIQTRAEHLGGEILAEPEELARCLQEECKLSEMKAEGIVQGKRIELEPEEVERIAVTFALHEGILDCVLAPPSSEVLHHALVDLVGDEDSFNVERCEQCRELAARVQNATPKDFRDELLQLCYDILDHVIILRDEDEELLSEEDMPFIMTLLPALMQLSQEARRRVLAYAYQELAQTTDGVGAKTLAAYAKLRSEHFSPLVKQVFDALSEAPGGRLTAAELAEQLHLKDTQPLKAVARATEEALAALEAASGHRLDERPLEVLEAPFTFYLSPAARQCWEALVLVERSF